MTDPAPRRPSQPDDRARRRAAQRLLDRRDEILSTWVERIRGAIPAAQDREAPVLIDHIPKFLDCLAQIIAGEAGLEAIPEPPSYARIHGELRARLEDSTLGEVFVEYALLREVAMEVLERDEPLPLDVRKLLQGGIDEAVRDAVEQYVASTQREVQLSEQRLRRLQALSDLALARFSIDELLPELLERLRRMLSADTAAVLLRRHDTLHVRAAAGLEEEVLQQVSVPVGEGFAGRIAATGRPLIVPDTRQVELVSPVLRERIRSLLGVPLCLEEEAVGVLHVGTKAPRDFTEEDQEFLQLVADRVALAIDRARLVQDLRRANERKSEFLAMLAHEMRTPLSAVNSAAYLLQQIALDDRALRQLDTIQRQTGHLARLVEDLVDISRISRGKIELRQERLDLREVVRDAIQAVQPFIDARGQALVLALPPEPVRVCGDPVRLTQVLVNLLNNAAKYTAPGGRIFASVEIAGAGEGATEGGSAVPAVLAGRRCAIARVRDTGIGIAPYVLPTLFDLFAQVDPSEAKSHGGLGVGLHLVKRLTELHGGAVTARSAGEGEGAEFAVWLPLQEHGAETPACGDDR